MESKDIEFVGTWDAYEKGLKAGIKEAVDWIAQNNNEPWIYSKADGSESHPASIGISWHNWQTKLKEWGLTPHQDSNDRTNT